MRAFALVSLFAVLAPPAAAQPVAFHVLDATDAAGLPLAASSDWEPPPALYWTGVGVDAVVLVGGGYLFVQGLRALSVVDDAGLAAPLILLFGGVVTVVGGTAAGLAGYDLARVLGGDNPALARLFDPGHPVPPPGPPRYPVPGPPPGPRY